MMLKTIAAGALAVALAAGTAAPLSAQTPCTSDALDRVLAKYMGECAKYGDCNAWHQAVSAGGLVAPGAFLDQLTRPMTDFWNWFAGNSKSKVGPRHILFGQSLDGEVVTPTMRTFYTLLPSGDNTRYVRLYHRGGVSRLTMRVCVVDPITKLPVQSGNVVDVPRNSTPGKYYPLDGPNKELVVTNAAGKFVIVELQPRTYLRSFKYSLRVR